MNSILKELASGIMYSEGALLAWKDIKERFDKVSNSKTYQLQREIMLTHQSLDSVVTFFSKLRHLLAKYDATCAFPHIEGCF